MNKMYPDFAIKNKITRSYQVEVCHTISGTCYRGLRLIVEFLDVFAEESTRQHR
jgi:hypothetical protein